MASRGRHVEGTDGSDFKYRQKVVSRYDQLAAVNKRWAKLSVIQLLYIGMVAVLYLGRPATIDAIMQHHQPAANALLDSIARPEYLAGANVLVLVLQMTQFVGNRLPFVLLHIVMAFLVVALAVYPALKAHHYFASASASAMCTVALLINTYAAYSSFTLYRLMTAGGGGGGGRTKRT